MWTHWVARSNHPYEPFRAFADGRFAWRQLTRQFPEMLSAVLMPNHVHLILPATERSGAIRSRVEGFIGIISRKMRIEHLWQPLPDPSCIPDRQHLRRTVRYIALNPCRKKLCRDPIEWYWSTYREIMGATVESTVSQSALARELGETQTDFLPRFHRYVSSDPAVHVSGSPLPTAVGQIKWAAYPIFSVLVAAASALRVPISDVKQRRPLRSLFVHLAAQQGWRQPTLLAEICGIGPGGIRKILRQPKPLGVGAAALCLGDPRLLSRPSPAEVAELVTSGSMGGRG